MAGAPRPAEVASPAPSSLIAAYRSIPPTDRFTRRGLIHLLDDPPDTAAPFPLGGGGGRWPRFTGAVRVHPLIADAALAVLLALISTPWLLHQAHPGLGRWVLQVSLLVPLIWRRRYPVAVFATLSLVALLQWLFADRLVADLSLLVALYTVAVHRPRRTALAAAAILEVGVIMATLRWSLAGSWIRSLVFLTTMVAAAISLGINVRARRAHLATLVERAERLEHERDQQGRLAAVAERTRIAREMHDVLAHSLAVMVSLADGAAVKLTSDPQRAATAIAHVSELGRQSLRETRRLLGVLRADDTPGLTTPQPDIDQIGDLVAGVRATGLRASLQVSGDPFDIPPGAGLTVYRIVQEALTNCLKHASGARAVRVELRYRNPELQVEVTDDGLLPWPPDGGIPEPVPAPGHGLAGMRERASVYQGDIVAGPHSDGGWQLAARLRVGAGGAP